jgi:hypothetical protein
MSELNVIINPPKVISVQINQPKVINVTLNTPTPSMNVNVFQSALPYKVTIGPTPPINPSQNDIWIQV